MPSYNANISVENLEQLLNAFEKIPQAVKRNMVLAARTAAEGVRDYARAHHKFTTRSGAAENSIEWDEQRTDSGDLTSTRVFINPDVKHAIFQHEGTGKFGPSGQAYDIFPKNGKMLRFVTSPGTAPWRPSPYGRFHKDGFTFAYGVTHPGVKGDPYVYRAADDRRAWVNSVFDTMTQRSIKEAGF